MAEFMTAEFWLAVGQIIMIDILLGGDNAVVIALACRKLPPAQRKLGILWGTAGAIGLRVILIVFALALLSIGAPDALVLGAALVTLSGLAFKEQFCFAIPGIKLVPLLLPLLWLLEWLQVAWAAALVALVSGALLTLLALAKWRMPLHFDIGDKGRYQV